MNISIYRDELQKYENSRRNLLLVVGFTAVNLVLAFLKLNFYFLFSATIPMWLYYSGLGIIGIVVILIYLACWFFMGKQRWLILIPLVLFLLDCLLYAYVFYIDFTSGGNIDYSLIIDVVFHAYVMYYLVIGTMSWFKIRGHKEEDFADPQ